MYNSPMPTDGKPAPQGVSLGQEVTVFGKPVERHSNERIRQLLKSFGLRTSLIRLKVIDALLMLRRTTTRWASVGCTTTCWNWTYRCLFSACAKS